MLAAGDGVLALVEPEGHIAVWHEGPRAWRRMLDPFAQTPWLTRLVGGLELGAAVWWARRLAR